MFDFKTLKLEVTNVEKWLEKEFSLIRVGRANPAVLDGVRVDSYGTAVALNQVANIAVEDARSIRISPWDSSQIKAIEKSIIAANLGVSVSVDDKGVRVTFPELTGEKRAETVKIAKEKYEHARITLRKHRDHTIADIEKKEKAKEMDQDAKFRNKAEVEKIIGEANKKFDAAMAKKEKEITSG